MSNAIGYVGTHRIGVKLTGLQQLVFLFFSFFFVLQIFELFCQGDSRTITHRKVIWCGKQCVFENAGSVWECQGRFLVFFAGRSVFLKKACFGHVYIRLIKKIKTGGFNRFNKCYIHLALFDILAAFKQKLFSDLLAQSLTLQVSW